ncbi:MAG: TraR/DksA C4-type zinc finger protein [Candidatus Coatesbacteria bacterium]|nr:TraR/DksA C4-type zinc finger protein [Candidatus Coatesbacteria bacterium]
MDKKDLLFFRKLLTEQRASLLAQAAETLRETCSGVVTQGGDFADIASEESYRAMKYRLRDREQKLLSKIDKCLAKIEKGVYGICEGCGCDIDIERLKSRPVATLCISCKLDQEANEP